MKYIKRYKIFESTDLLIPNIDQYKPMIDLMSKLLDYHIDPQYLLNDNSEMFNKIYKILENFSIIAIENKIGDKKYSLSADDDNELNKLKEIKKIQIGHGEDITFDPDLYFEDIKFIDWLFWKIEQNEYHLKKTTNSALLHHRRQKSRIYSLTENDPIKDFKLNLDELKDFYNEAKNLDFPKYKHDDIEDMLLSYIDQRTIRSLGTYVDIDSYNNYDTNGELSYIVNFVVDGLNRSNIDPSKYKKLADDHIKKLCDEIYDTCFRRFFINKKMEFFSYYDTDSYSDISNVRFRLIEK